MKELEQFLTSVEVADMVGKEHSKLLRDIRRYSEHLNEAKIGLVDFFIESTYSDQKGENRPCYKVTKKGCEFIAHKLTGQKGTEFTAKYINKFHEMEDAVQNNPRKLSALEQIHLLAQGNVELEEKIDRVSENLESFKKDLPLLAVECEKITYAVRKKGVDLLGGKESEAYHDKSLRGKVYSDIYSQIKREFGVETFKAIKRSQCELAIKIVNEYKLPMALKEEIEDFNFQRFEV